MTDESLIHVKFEYEEAIESKKSILSTQLAFVKAIQYIREFKEFRMNELDLRFKLQKVIKSTINDLKNLKKILPKLEIPKIIDKEEKIEERRKKKQIMLHEDLEQELNDIRKRLQMIGG